MARKARSRGVGKAAVIPETELSRVAAGTSWHWLWLFTPALILAAMAYSPALNGTFIFDDFHLPFKDPNVDRMPLNFWIGGVRPLLMASYWVNYQLSGNQTFSYHAVNLMLHAGSAVLVFYLLQRILRLAGVRQQTRVASLCGAGLFLLHPLQTESVAYISGRSELLSGLFFLAAWLVFLKRFEMQITVAAASGILLLAAASVLGKESAISLPCVLLLTDFYWGPGAWRQQITKHLTLYVPIAIGAVFAAFVIVRSLAKAPSVGLAMGVSPFQYALTECRVILTYLRLFLWPVGQNGDWQLPFYRSLGDPGAALWLLGLLLLLGAIVWAYRWDHLLSFGLLLFLVLLLPTSSFVPINDALAERRMYLPIVGLILASTAIVHRLRWDVATARVSAIGLLTIAAALTFHRSRVWSNDIVFWKSVTSNDPNKRRAHLGLASAYMFHRRFQDAIKEYDTVDQLVGTTEETIHDRITAYEYLGDSSSALDGLHKLTAMHPTAYAYSQIGHIEAVLKHSQQALAAFNLALLLDPKYAPAYAERGTVFHALGDDSRAGADFKNALTIEPDNKIAIAGISQLALDQ